MKYIEQSPQKFQGIVLAVPRKLSELLGYFSLQLPA